MSKEFGGNTESGTCGGCNGRFAFLIYHLPHCKAFRRGRIILPRQITPDLAAAPMATGGTGKQKKGRR